jgi:type I restriction enzyme S subunit
MEVKKGLPVRNEVKAGYKKMEVGIIPVDWEVKKLGDCLTKNPDYGINAAAVHYTDTLPTYLRITDISDDGNYINKNRVSVNHQLSNFYFLEEGDIVFARTGASVGRTYLYNMKDGKLVFAGFLIRIRPNIEILDPAFLKFHTQTKYYWNWVISNSMRSGQPGLNSNEYKSFKIPLPPLPEQKAIAEVLSDTDNLIQALEKRIAKKRLIKQGTMQKLLSPKDDWEVEELIKLASITTGSKNTQDRIDDGKYPFFVRSQTIERIDSYSFNGEAVLTAGDGVGTGKIFHYINGKFDFHQRVYKISHFNEKLDGYFFFLYFSNNFYNRIMQMTAKSSVDSVRMEMIANMKIPLPPLPEQKNIAEVLSDMDSEIETLEKKLAKYKQLKQGLMQNLLTGKIRLV